jgi:Family of unknown function (DUF6171)
MRVMRRGVDITHLTTGKPAAPSLSTRAKNFSRAAFAEAKAIAQGVPKVSEEEAERRLEICRSCDEFIPEKMGCRKCGCRLRVKTAWRAVKCPIDKW